MDDSNKKPVDIEMILAGLHVFRKIVTPFADLFDRIGDEVEKLQDEHFFFKKRLAISEQRILYEHFGKNPLHAWQAIHICQECNFEEKPEWALAVVLASAKDLVSLDSGGASINSQLKQATGIDGHKFSQFQDNMFWLDVLHETHALIDKGMAQKAAFLQIAKNHHGKAGSEATVEKRYFEFRRVLQEVPFPHPFDL